MKKILTSKLVINIIINRIMVVMLMIAALLLSLTSSLYAETPMEKGYEIAARSDRSDRGFKTSIAKLTMTLKNAAGNETIREMEIKTQEKQEENVGDKSVTLFFTPPDVEGTALLSHAKILDSDDQWLFLPELARIKRISSSNKSGPFVGSEFSFEDLTAAELGKYSYKYLETTTLDGMQVDVLEQKPLYKRSGYTKLIAYYDQEINQLRKVEFYNRGGTHFKTLIQSEFKNFGGTIYRPMLQEMNNHLTKKSTTLRAESYQFGVELDENEFKSSALSQL
ncbi:MAG: outer membrane lipoprotein-sorting protein [Pseudomonadota bacterium]